MAVIALQRPESPDAFPEDVRRTSDGFGCRNETEIATEPARLW